MRCAFTELLAGGAHWRESGEAALAEGRPREGILKRLFLSKHGKYCHNGGMAFAHHHGVGLPGSMTVIMAPPAVA